MNRLLALLVFIIAILSSLTGSSAQVHAANLQGLSITPLRTELNIPPGTAQTNTLTMTNNTSKQMSVHMDAEKFTVTDEQYDYSFNATASIVKWVHFSKSDLVIPPGKSQKITYTIGVPVDGEPGSKYFSLFATTSTVNGSTEVKSEQRVASLVYLTVDGNTTELGRLISLKSPWLTTKQDQWTMEIQNAGTAHFHSSYSVTVQDLLGHKVGSYRGNSLIIAASVRSITGTLPAPVWPGLYRAVYSASMGNNATYTHTALFVYVPLWSVGVLAVIVAMIIITIMYIRSLRKDRKA